MTMLEKYLDFFQEVSTHYFLIAGLAFVIFYIVLWKKISHKKIQPGKPDKKHYYREIGFSILTMIIFSFVPLVVLDIPSVEKHTTFYKNINDHSRWYFFLAFPLMFLIHDAYFYWTHRLMHHKKLFRYFHLVHHQSTNPSPWAAYSFHPLEAIVEAGIFVVFLFTMPIHVYHILIFFLLMIIYNVYGHLGYELYPHGFNRSWIGRWINTSTSHNQHHQYFKGNYSLYFTFWDRLMGTMRADYDERFARATRKVNG